jgi:hypothetical protein
MIIGLVGKPNVGKSAFFRSLTLAEAESGNFPFTTIDANSAIGYVKIKDPAQEFNKSSNPREGYVMGEWRFVPTQIIDVAGLVPGASEGKGLGNKFLDDLRQADALIHVIDLSGSTNEKGEPVELNSYDPKEDILFLEVELNNWFYSIMQKHAENISKKIRMQDKKIEDAIVEVMSGLNVKIDHVIQAVQELQITKTNFMEKIKELSMKLREISKPMIIAANKCDVLLENNLWETKLKQLQEEFPNYIIVPVMAEYEYNLKKATEAKLISYIPGEKEFTILDETKLTEQQKKGLFHIANALTHFPQGTGVQHCINAAIFDLLEMIAVCPGGSKLEDKNGNTLPDCFLMPKGTTALDFAYRLHTDFGKHFIKAIDIKTKRMVGKEHQLKTGDIIEIVSGK